MNFFRGNQGNSVIESSLLLGLVACGIIIFTYGLGAFTTDSMNQVTKNIAATNIDSKSAVSKTVEPTKQAEIYEMSSVAKWSFIIGCSVIFLGAVACYVVSSKQKKLHPEVVDVQATDAPNERLFSKRHQILTALKGDLGSNIDDQYVIRHLMSEEIISVLPDFPVKEIKQLMKKKSLRHLMVCDVKKKLLGIISDRDVKHTRRKTAADIMTRDPLAITPDALVSPAITMMMNKRISCLPVVEDEKLRGVFTTTDIMMTLQCTLQILQKAAVKYGKDFTNQLSQPQQEEELAASN